MSQRSYVDTYFDIVWSQAGPTAPPESGVSTTHLRAALTCIAKHATWKNGEGSYPIQDTLVGESGMSRAGLNRAIKCAVALGWLVKEKGAPNRSRGVTYKLIVPTSAQKSHGETSHLETTHHETNESVTMRQTNVSPCDTTHVSTHTLTQKEDKGRLVGTTRASQPAAAPRGQDLILDHDQPRQAAAASREPSQTSTAATQDDPSEELVVWLGTTLKERVAGLVQAPGEVKRGQVKPALRTLKRWAKGDEAQVRAYLADELDRQEGRDASEKARSISTLISWLADKRSWATWQAAAAVPRAGGVLGSHTAPTHRGRPPRPGMVWNEHINDWTNATAIHTGLFKRINLGSDDDDIVYDPTAATTGVQR